MKLALVLAIVLAAATANAGQPALSKGQLVYVPAYSHIYIGDKERPFQLAITLCVRNASQNEPIRVASVEYVGDEGQLLKQYVQAPREIKKLASACFTVPESEKVGGAGAKFLVRWEANAPIAPPLVETVMVGTGGQQGVSFTSRGEVLAERE